MPIRDIQMRFRELGRIRAGEKGAKGQPVKRTTWRLTSAREDYLQRAAAVCGGTVQRWDGAPTTGEQYELATDSDTLECLIPPGDPVTQWNELWSGGGCLRRCDGYTNVITDSPCECPADPAQRSEMSKKGKACKPTTRLSVILPWLPDVGVWRLETHGYNAAVEMPGTVRILERLAAADRMVPAQLRLDQRTDRVDGQTRHYIVPVLELPTLTIATLTTGESPVEALDRVDYPKAALGAGNGHALPSLPGEEDTQMAGAANAGGSPSGQPASHHEEERPAPSGDAQPATPASPSTKVSKPAANESPFVRAIRTRAKSLGMTRDQLDALVTETVGKPSIDALDGPAEANRVLAALRSEPAER